MVEKKLQRATQQKLEMDKEKSESNHSTEAIVLLLQFQNWLQSVYCVELWNSLFLKRDIITIQKFVLSVAIDRKSFLTIAIVS